MKRCHVKTNFETSLQERRFRDVMRAHRRTSFLPALIVFLIYINITTEISIRRTNEQTDRNTANYPPLILVILFPSTFTLIISQLCKNVSRARKMDVFRGCLDEGIEQKLGILRRLRPLPLVVSIGARRRFHIMEDRGRS